MATTAGIAQVTGVTGTWVQLPSQACTSVTFQKGNYDIAYSGTPGANFFRLSSSTAPFTLPVVANANTLYIRGFSGPISFIWSS